MMMPIFAVQRILKLIPLIPPLSKQMWNNFCISYLRNRLIIHSVLISKSLSSQHLIALTMKRTLHSYFSRIDSESEPATKRICVSDDQILYQNDISVFAQDSSVKSSDERLKIVDNSWIPPAHYHFKKSTPKNLSFQKKWLDEYSWLAYSAKDDGGYCKYCVACGMEVGGKGDIKLGKLVNQPFNNWKHAQETFKKHEKKEYHKKSILAIEHLRDIQLGRSKSIILQVDQQYQQMEKENYERLKPIVSTIVLCGRQGIALRGHRDDGSLFQRESEANVESSNDGNFRAILRYRAEGDKILKENLLSSAKNASYLSKTIQNEMIEICHKLIRAKIVDKVNRAKGFSVLADESTDISSIEQFSICVRYLDSELNICEDFLGFVPVTDASGKALANSIITYLQGIGVDCSYMYGQGYDGAPAMSGEFHGAQAYVQSYYPLAIYVHCAAHSFNLVINSACKISGIINALGTIQAIEAFFHWPKRIDVLKNEISKMTTQSERKRQKLKSLCTTRWAQSHETVSAYVELQPAVIEALELIISWGERKTSSDASQLLTAILNVEFQISCQIMESVHSIVLPLSRSLQLKNQDLGEAMKLADDVLNEFKRKRQIADLCFHQIYERVTEICSEYEIEMKMRRRDSNFRGTEVVENYYRTVFYVPFLDTYICHLQSRFEMHKSIFRSFGQLFRNEEFDEKKCADLYKFYEQLFDCSEVNFISEVKMWRQRICDLNIENVLDALSIISEKTFVNVNTILRVMAVLPVTTATPERSFSTLKRIKTYLRNTIGQERLNGLASLNIHQTIVLTEGEILQEFFKKPRRLSNI